MHDVALNRRCRAFIKAHTAPRVKMTRQLRMKMAISSLVTRLVIMYVCLIFEAMYAEQCWSLMGRGHGMMKGGTLGWRKVRVRVRGPKTMNSTRPQQQCLDAKAELVLSLHLGKDLCPVLCRCGLVCLLGGYGAGVVEMLLMMSGDVEPNPGPIGQLVPGDLVNVLTELIGICSKWYNIGLGLGLTADILDAMKAPSKEHEDCLRDMLKKWLNTSPDPSWQSLIEVLRSPIVGKEPLARHLETKYCKEGSVPPAAQSIEAEPCEPIDKRFKKLEKEFRSFIGLACKAIKEQDIDAWDFKERLSRLGPDDLAEHRRFIDYLIQKDMKLRLSTPQDPSTLEKDTKLKQFTHQGPSRSGSSQARADIKRLVGTYCYCVHNSQWNYTVSYQCKHQIAMCGPCYEKYKDACPFSDHP